ncbi:MAG: ATP-binding cassette domain-containing protein [Gemmatimonadetes bacterium]|nr:ATP-binding cassette domain-containing protein [Gemmatimonadota bacterium]
MPPAVVSFQNIRKVYPAALSGVRGGVVALDGVSGEVHEGEIVGVAGTGGAGKSTLLRIAAGMLRADSGEVSWLGAAACPPRLAAFIPSHTILHEFLTVRESLRFAAVQGELSGARRVVAEDLWPARLGLAHRLEARVGTLTTVERRIVALAAALQGAPALVAFDGALDGLDPTARRDLRRALQVVSSSGVAVLIGAADLGVLAGVAHRGALLREGRLVAWIDPRAAAPRNALELAVGAPRVAAARLRRHVAASCRRDGAVRVPLADRSAEEVLALCREEGIRVLRSRVVTEPVSRWTVP